MSLLQIRNTLSSRALVLVFVFVAACTSLVTEQLQGAVVINEFSATGGLTDLDGEDGRRFGFELTIFRFALAPALDASISQWRTRQVYIAHLGITVVLTGVVTADLGISRDT